MLDGWMVKRQDRKNCPWHSAILYFFAIEKKTNWMKVLLVIFAAHSRFANLFSASLKRHTHTQNKHTHTHADSRSTALCILVSSLSISQCFIGEGVSRSLFRAHRTHWVSANFHCCVACLVRWYFFVVQHTYVSHTHTHRTRITHSHLVQIAGKLLS